LEIAGAEVIKIGLKMEHHLENGKSWNQKYTTKAAGIKQLSRARQTG